MRLYQTCVQEHTEDAQVRSGKYQAQTYMVHLVRQQTHLQRAAVPASPGQPPALGDPQAPVCSSSVRRTKFSAETGLTSSLLPALICRR